VRLVEVRLLDGPNVYLLEPAVRIEIALGRRRSWYGQRSPGRHGVVHLGAAVAAKDVPPPIAAVAGWVRQLHAVALSERGVRPRIHRTSEPGHWVVTYPWHESGRAEAIANGAFRLTERRADPLRDAPPGQLIRHIRDADTRPPSWITDQERRVPAISISGTNGKSTTTRMIAHILRTAGRRVGLTTSDGVIVDDVMVEEGDLTGPLGAQRVLQDPSVEVAVLETARGGILLRGLGYQSNDAAVLTNISPDHLDLQGIHTLPELAEVKSVIARVTRPQGTVVLNADDPLVAAVARRVKAGVCYFSLKPASARTRRHLDRGGRAILSANGWIVEAAGERRKRIVALADVPATVGGAARHNVANALAAAGGAMALGASRAQVAAGLRSFRPTSAQMPGRLNFYRLGNRVILVDFAHNAAGLAVVMDMVDALIGKRGRRRRATLTTIVGTAGDRPDDGLRAVGRLAGSRSDQVAIKETLHYLRGRTRQSVIGELSAGLREGGVRVADVPVYGDEVSALRAELTTSGRLAADDGGAHWLLLMCHEAREPVLAELETLGARSVTDVAEIVAKPGG